MNPAVLILSYGNVSPVDIVENILYKMSQPKVLTTTLCESLSINSYKCDISNKYFSTSISLIAFDGNFESVPSEIRKSTEALIIYFDPSDKSFINKLSEINEFVESNNIELGFLLTSSLSGKPKEISFDDLRVCTNMVFDIITLKEDTENTSESNGYSEILEGLTNCVWSNVKVKGSSNSNRKHSNDNEDLENELNDFENLLITAQSLRSNTHLSRDEILNKAEELAKIMSTILNDNDSD